MSYKKLRKKFTPEELADAFVFPVKLTAKQKKEAAEQLAAARKKSRETMSDETKFGLRAFGTRFRIEDSLQEETFEYENSFGAHLKNYVELMEKKRKEFAAEISIDETLLSQLINGHRLPPDYVAIRLEIHSNNIIPAVLWLKLVDKQRLHEIANNKELRRKEKQFVYPQKGPKKKTHKKNHPTSYTEHTAS
jgi:plasmid maintenance system antidote protein VapI